MTRVYHVRSQQAPQRSRTLDQSRANVKKKKPYKILLEAVTQEKKKLHSILTYASNAPIGFGFIPAGHPEFTEWCKEQCRQRNLDVHVVSAKPKNKTHSDPEKLSHHVHRVGHHFPIHIIELACSKFGYIYDERRGLRKDKEGDRTNWIAQEFEDYSSRQVQHGHPATAKETKGYIHGAVREMFPKIPEADLQAIVSHAFEEGTNRVGNAKELSLARRVQLAVVAHIRHTYTDYDKLLKTDGWSEARSQVEKVSLAKLKEWRDEDGKQSDELEETFREVIVLDDDDDDASSDEGSMSTPDEREQSMEIVSSRATARDLQPESHTNYSRVDAYDMRRAPRRTIVLQRYPPPAQPAGLSGSSHSQSLLQQQPFQSAQARTTDPQARPAEAGHSLRSAQPIVREINGQLYQLQPIKETLGAPRSQYDPSPHPAPRRVQEGLGQPLLPCHSALDRPPTQIRRPSDQDVVIPSVEPETIDLTSPRRAAASRQPVRHHNANVTRPYNEVPSPKRKALPSFANDSESYSEQHTKRLRPVYREKVDSLNYHDGPARFHSSQRMAPNNGPRAPPREKIIDLTTSPHHLPTSGGRGYDVPARSFAAADTRGHAYALGPSHRMPVREVRGAQYDMPAVEPSRTYMPDNRVYERRAPPNHDYVPLREDQQPRRLEEESARYLRNGVRYGG